MRVVVDVRALAARGTQIIGGSVSLTGQSVSQSVSADTQSASERNDSFILHSLSSRVLGGFPLVFGYAAVLGYCFRVRAHSESVDF